MDRDGGKEGRTLRPEEESPGALQWSARGTETQWPAGMPLMSTATREGSLRPSVTPAGTGAPAMALGLALELPERRILTPGSAGAAAPAGWGRWPTTMSRLAVGASAAALTVWTTSA